MKQFELLYVLLDPSPPPLSAVIVHSSYVASKAKVVLLSNADVLKYLLALVLNFHFVPLLTAVQRSAVFVLVISALAVHEVAPGVLFIALLL